MALKIYDMSWMVHFGGKSTDFKDYTFQGYPLGGIKFFVKNLVIDLLGNNSVICCFDSKTNKRDILEGYKSGRPHEQYIVSQCLYAYDMLMSCGVSCLKEEGYEADDLIHTVVNRFRNMFREIVCISNDHDIAHNVFKHVRTEAASLYGMDINANNFTSAVQKGDVVEYNTISAYKCLIGDPSDKIPVFTASNGLKGRQLYNQFIIWGNENLPNNESRPFVFSRREILEYFLRTLNLSECDSDILKRRMDVVFPRDLADKEITLTKKEDIVTKTFVKLLSILDDTTSLTRLGWTKERLTDEDINFFRRSAQVLRDGTFAVDNDLPVHSTFIDTSTDIVNLRLFE